MASSSGVKKHVSPVPGRTTHRREALHLYCRVASIQRPVQSARALQDRLHAAYGISIKKGARARRARTEIVPQPQQPASVSGSRSHSHATYHHAQHTPCDAQREWTRDSTVDVETIAWLDESSLCHRSKAAAANHGGHGHVLTRARSRQLRMTTRPFLVLAERGCRGV